MSARLHPLRSRSCGLTLEELEGRSLLSTFTVDRLTDGGEGSNLTGDLRYCITQATNDDTVEFSVSGTINLTGPLPDLTHNIIIHGTGADQLTVRRDTGGFYRIFTVANGAMISVTGLTIADGTVNGDDGGGIRNSGTLVLDACTVSSNSALAKREQRYSEGGNAGGIDNAGVLILTDCTIMGNSADRGGLGGAIYSNGALTLSDCTISNNSGGLLAIWYDQGPTIVSNCVITANSRGEGGIEGNGPLTVSDSTISDNSGYGIWNGSGTLTVKNCTISGNSGYGIRNNQNLTISNSTIAGNKSGGIEKHRLRGCGDQYTAQLHHSQQRILSTEVREWIWAAASRGSYSAPQHHPFR
jgi:predicted outer membrane repeat protein